VPAATWLSAVRFGLFFLVSVPESHDNVAAFQNEIDQMVLADELYPAFDGIWIGEHHFSPYGTVGSAMALSAFAAASTKHTRIGQAVNVLPFLHPIRLAEDAAMIDILSGGRLNFGIGRGYSALEYGGLGISMDESRQRFNESIDIILEAWTKPAFSYSGEFFQVPHISIYPRPIQRPCPPIWMACTSPPTVAWAAERGFAYLQDHMQPLAQLVAARSAYAERLAAAPDHIRAARLLADSAVLRCAYLAEDDRAARREPEPFVLWYQSALAKYGSSSQDGAYSSAYTYQRQMAEQSRDRDYDWYLDNVALFGDPARVVDDLQRFGEVTGVQHVMLWMNFGGMPAEQARRNLLLFAERVMPRLA
jgi:alkanesulfonate monooxygenase SsuD/methylene tetrahydromethanopterin reductase-like flavin-dependent oxidoreductase (luciferase family)